MRDITKDLLEWQPPEDRDAAIASASVMMARALGEIINLRDLISASQRRGARQAISLSRPLGLRQPELTEPVELLHVVLDRLQPYADEAMKHLTREQEIKDMRMWRMELSGEFMHLAELALPEDEDDGE